MFNKPKFLNLLLTLMLCATSAMAAEKMSDISNRVLTLSKENQLTGLLALQFEHQSDADKNKDIKRIHSLVLYKAVGGESFEETKRIPITSLKNEDGVVVYSVKKFDAIKIKSQNPTDQGGDVNLMLLRDITSITDRWNESIVFDIKMKGSNLEMTYNGKTFNHLDFEARRFRGEEIGIQKVSFCVESCTKKNLEEVGI